MDLAVRTPTLELRYPDDELLFALADLARSPIHPPEMMPFAQPWSDVSPDERARSTLQFQWKCRGAWDAADWHCPMVAVAEGIVIGTQSIFATSFASTRTVATGSWLGMDHQGKGYGKEMRAAALHLAFEGLDSERCESGAFDDNAASLGVSRSLGYVENGDEIRVRRETTGRIVRLVLHRSAWSRRDDISISGLDGCRAMFGA
jgi:RimJ/RimL family protein N-acetyltransferase